MTGHIGRFEGINPSISHDQRQPSEKVKALLNTPPKGIIEEAIAAGAILGAVIIGSGAALLVSPTWMAMGALLGTGILIGGALTAALLASAQIGKTLNKAAQSKMACTIANKMTDSFKKLLFQKVLNPIYAMNLKKNSMLLNKIKIGFLHPNYSRTQN